MDALLMAGGRGSRMTLPIEKPLLEINGRKLIEYAMDALEGSRYVDNIYIAASKNGPDTVKWLEGSARDVNVVNTAGDGYVSDMVDAIRKAGIKGPVLIVMADLPLITPGLLDEVIVLYSKVPQPALSVYNLLSVCRSKGLRPDTVFNKDGQLIVPSGINILDADNINEEQDDYNYILNNHKIAVNVNTVEDLEICSKFMKQE
ncbi:MAG: NTP transferase domain-containing protein [Methanosarcinales archaeon]|nr:NTP transferase domain-containing protein [Methanosarcinales archaeon]